MALSDRHIHDCVGENNIEKKKELSISSLKGKQRELLNLYFFIYLMKV